MKKLIQILIVLFFAIPTFAGDTYYIDDAGSNGNGGTGCADAWATFAYAFGRMRAGDTLYICDGTYTEQLSGMPSGTIGDHTEIYAVNPYGVLLDGEDSRTPLVVSSKSYVDIRGIRAKDGLGSYGNHVIYLTGSSNITVKQCGAWNAGTYKHNMPFAMTGCSSCLVEDVYVFGRGRYSIYDFNGSGNTLRRVVARWDFAHIQRNRLQEYQSIILKTTSLKIVSSSTPTTNPRLSNRVLRFTLT